ncbi:ankyrin and HET domain-containing protein [Colletotrichum cuscutae]|uniref:Ankyrin and HET domain-containing protein n=1 Tax=Colletotrichum cuscutae TaxID=1209917 RepID=A0AAI9Y407_9PEZI|nr:ankyrin and HET domain-containing protein [Colletotrichum cuscutae]
MCVQVFTTWPGCCCVVKSPVQLCAEAKGSYHVIRREVSFTDKPCEYKHEDEKDEEPEPSLLERQLDLENYDSAVLLAAEKLRTYGPEFTETIESSDQVYGPLTVDGEHIRILTLLPGDSLSSTVEVRLSIVNLSDPTMPYDALSYMWGDSTERESIIANGKALRITRSLASALRYLRHSDREVTIWADGICIDQSNDDEKNVQVALMSEIYTKAASVRIWLGEAGRDTNSAIKLMEHCEKAPTMADVVGRVTNDERGTLGLLDLLRRPYWSRMWMFQEILLSKTGYLQCGTFSTSCDVLKYLDVVSSKAQLWPADGTSSLYTTELRRALFDITQFTIASKELRDLEHVLSLTGGLNATNPRDKLYALMGTCDMSQFLDIHYDKSVRDVYVEFTRNYANNTRNLSIVMLAGGDGIFTDDDGKAFPSWTPDFRTCQPENNIYAAMATAGTFNACIGKLHVENQTQEPESTLPQEILGTQGIIWDDIRMTTRLFAGENGLKHLLRDFDFTQSETTLSGKSRLQALCETLIFDDNGIKKGDTQDTLSHKTKCQLEHMLGFMREIELSVGALASSEVAGAVLNEAASADTETQMSFTHLLRNYEKLRQGDSPTIDQLREVFVRKYSTHVGRGSKLLVTRDGLVGRSHDKIQEGDVVAILFGCDIPVVLRREGSNFSTSNDIDASQNAPSSGSGDTTSTSDSNFIEGYFERAAELGCPSLRLTRTAGPRLSPDQLVNNLKSVKALEATYHPGKTSLFFLLHYVLLDKKFRSLTRAKFTGPFLLIPSRNMLSAYLA